MDEAIQMRCATRIEYRIRVIKEEVNLDFVAWLTFCFSISKTTGGIKEKEGTCPLFQN